MVINKNIFKEYDIRGKYPQELSPELAQAIAAGFFAAKKIKRLVIARDRRPESKLVLTQAKKAATTAGIVLVDLGIQSTPALFFSLGKGNYDGGIMITASHSPKGIAGMKFCLASGQAISGIELRGLVGRSHQSVERKGKIKKVAAKRVEGDYTRFALAFIDKNKLKKLKIIIDASSGSGANLAQAVFRRLPVRSTKMNFIAGDRFPDHGLNPLLPENQKSIVREVKRQGADLGLIFDGDADRAVLIDEKGGIAHPYHLNCLLSRIILEKYHLKRIVVDGRLEYGIKETISRFGGQAVVGRSGWAHFVDLMTARKIKFGCENSGHFFINFSFKSKKNYAYSDAVIPVLLVLEYLSKRNQTLSAALREYRTNYYLSGEINLAGVDFKKSASKIAARYKKYHQSKKDGLSVYGPDWFFNFRPSHTEPLARLNIEARSRKILQKIKGELSGIIK